MSAGAFWQIAPLTQIMSCSNMGILQPWILLISIPASCLHQRCSPSWIPFSLFSFVPSHPLPAYIVTRNPVQRQDFPDLLPDESLLMLLRPACVGTIQSSSPSYTLPVALSPDDSLICESVTSYLRSWRTPQNELVFVIAQVAQGDKPLECHVHQRCLLSQPQDIQRGHPRRFELQLY